MSVPDRTPAVSRRLPADRARRDPATRAKGHGHGG